MQARREGREEEEGEELQERILSELSESGRY